MREHLDSGLWLWAHDCPAPAPAGPDHLALSQHPRKELHCPFVLLSINELFTVLGWGVTSPAVELLVSVGRGGDGKPAWIPKHGRENVTQLRSDSLLLENQYPRERQMLIERKNAFNHDASYLGRWWTQYPPKSISEDSALPWKFLTGKREIISVDHWDRGVRVIGIPHCVQACRLLVIFLQMLYCSYSLITWFVHWGYWRRS